MTEETKQTPEEQEEIIIYDSGYLMEEFDRILEKSGKDDTPWLMEQHRLMELSVQADISNLNRLEEMVKVMNGVQYQLATLNHLIQAGLELAIKLVTVEEPEEDNADNNGNGA